MNKQQALFRKIVLDQDHTDLIVLVRIIVGTWIFIYGSHILDREWYSSSLKMWEAGFPPYGKLMLISSKSAEMLGGILLAAGLLTRFASSMLIIVMSVASFYAMKGDILPYGKGELPFFYLLFFIVFLISGGGKYSLDRILWKNKSVENTQV